MSERVVKHFRTTDQNWNAFAARVGEHNASGVLRRLIAVYMDDERLQRKIGKTPDPSPDRRMRVNAQ